MDVPSSPPDTPVGAAPLGTTTALRPEFIWAQISGADQYYLWVADTEGQVWDAWYAEDIICQTGTCRVTLSFDLFANDFRWWLQAWSETNGYSDWSAQHDFRVAVPPRPPVDFQVGHTGEVVTYEWRPVRGVSWYYLWVSSSSTGHVLDQWYNASNICTSEWCTVSPAVITTPPPPTPTPIVHQANAIHSWWVQGYNDAGGYGAWSSEQQFVYSSAPDWSHSCSFVGSPRGWSINSYSGVSMGQHDSGGFTSNTSGTDNLDIRSPAMSGTFEIETAQFYFNGSWIGQNQRIIVYQTGNSAIRYGTSLASSQGVGDPINLLMSQAVNVSTISINLDRNVDGNAQYFGTLRLTGITLSGTGTNPFGVADCALIATPTSTPTITATPTYEGCGLPFGGDPESTEEPICYVYTPQPTPTASPTATHTFKIRFASDDILDWSPTEQLEISEALTYTSIALRSVSTVGDSAVDVFNRAMVNGDTLDYILFVRGNSTTDHDNNGIHDIQIQNPSNQLTLTLNVNHGNCLTVQGTGANEPTANAIPRIIVCNGNFAVTQYTITHELGHIFVNRSIGAMYNEVHNSSTQPCFALDEHGNNLPTGNCIVDRQFYVVMGNILVNDPEPRIVWARGERGWGSGPSHDTNGRAIISNFQQHPTGLAADEDMFDETTADLFLNWVYRKVTDYPPVSLYTLPSPFSGNWLGFLNRSWQPTDAYLGGMCNTVSGCPDGRYPGDARYEWLNPIVTLIVQSHGW